MVLAAGFSRRLGRPKVMARIRGTSLLERTVRVVAPLSAAPVIVVLPPRAARARIELDGLGVEIAACRRRSEGLSASVKCGVTRARRGAAVLLLPVDLPGLERRELRRLVARWRGARRALIARRVGSPGGSVRAGTPLILPRRLYAAALSISGDLGLRELANGTDAAESKLVDLPSAATDVDTREELQAARRRY